MGQASARRHRAKRFGCYLCGRPFTQERRPTKDHIVPECWFPLPLPRNIPTRKACLDCNQALSPREERVRNLLVKMHLQEPEALAELMERARRSNRTLRLVGRGTWKLDSGLLTPVPLAQVDMADFSAVFEKITRGLHFINYRRPLAVEHPMKVVPLTKEAGASLTRLLMGEWGRKVQWVGEALAWTNALDSEHPEDGVWLYLPLHAAVTAVCCGRAASLQLPTASLAALREP